MKRTSLIAFPAALMGFGYASLFLERSESRESFAHAGIRTRRQRGAKSSGVDSSHSAPVTRNSRVEIDSCLTGRQG